MAYETYGTLSESADNAVFVCHALTGDAHAAGWHDGDARPGWWDNLIGPGKPLDTDRFFVICANLIGGCQGSTGPSSTNPATGQAYGLDFPVLMTRDLVAVHRALVQHLGITRLLAAIGGSLGGMQVLQWGLDHPEDVANALVIAASSRLTAQNIAFSAVARRAIMSDPNFEAGSYAAAGVNPDVGLSIARMMAHITYLSEDALTEKFGRQVDPNRLQPGFGIDFTVESYLAHQGQVFLERFDALSYLYLTRVMDYFDPFADPKALDAVTVHPGELAGAVVRDRLALRDQPLAPDRAHPRARGAAGDLPRDPVQLRARLLPAGHRAVPRHAASPTSTGRLSEVSR